MYANTYFVHNVHNSTVGGRVGGLFTGFVVLFSSLSAISIFKKGVQAIIGLKLKIRIMSSVSNNVTQYYLQKMFSDI